jgi:HlyD family secretion protein
MADQSSHASDFSSSKTTLATYSNTIAGHLSDLLSAQTNIEDSKDSSQNADLDLEDAELNVKERQNALRDAQGDLADYSIRAPYEGTVANLEVKRLDSVSSGTALATITTNKKLALISLNEVDVAKIKVGESANLTFDAIPDLIITGVVSEINSVGTVNQGVVTYDVKIAFNQEDERIKPSMSVSADIITDKKENVLVVPNSAIKSQGGKSYVETFEVTVPVSETTPGGFTTTIAPNRIPVEIGLSNDSQTEIISGINEGDEIVVRTITGSTTTAAAPSLFGNPARSTTTRTPRAN